MLLPAFADRPWVMGVVNVTEDSFSDGGRYLDTDAAIEHGVQLVRDGAALVDVGGESTRPGAHRVDPQTERDRVVPVIAGLVKRGVTCSVDTTRAGVATDALAAGASIVNDVSGGMADPDMARVVADARVPWILMHWRGPSDIMASLAHYRDAVTEVRDELLARIDVALASGVDERSLVIDPGIGFAKDAEHNWQVLRGLSALTGLGLPVLLGASRKRFLGSLLADPDGTPRPADGREAATAAISLLAAQHEVWGVRVHDVRATADVFAVRGRMDSGDTVSSGASGQGSPVPLIDVSTAASGPVRVGALRRPGVGSAAAGQIPRRDVGSMTPPADRPSAGRITLTGLTVRGHHGVFDFEKRDGQDFVVDIAVFTAWDAAGQSDRLDNTVNYADLAAVAQSVVAGESKDLIETVADEIAAAVVARWSVAAVEVTVHKPHAPIDAPFADVSVSVRRAGSAMGSGAVALDTVDSDTAGPGAVGRVP